MAVALAVLAGLADPRSSRRCAPCARRRSSSTGSTSRCSRCSSPPARCGALRAASPVPTAAGEHRAARRDRAARQQAPSSRSRATAPSSPSPASQFDALRGWLGEARSAARARPVEAQLVKAATGYSGSITVSLGGRLMIRRKRNRQLWAPTVASHRLERVDARRAGLGRRARRRGALGRSPARSSASSSACVLFAPAAWLAERGGLGHRPAAGPRRCARHDLVRQRRAGPHRRRRQPRRELPARPPRVDARRRGSTASSSRRARTAASTAR